MEIMNFISTESLEKISGGWSGINFHLYNALKDKVEVKYQGPINLPFNKIEHFISKIQKSLNLPRNLVFFSKKRLKQIEGIVSKKVSDPYTFNFFWGHMPWLQCNFQTPYAVYLDITISKYLQIFQSKEKFKNKDLKRIEQLELRWLNNASYIFWGSDWAKKEAQKTLNINNPNQQIVWLGGNIPIPNDININVGLNFVFISLRFKEKGGNMAFEAFKEIFTKYTQASLTIIGESPPKDILNHPGVNYVGYLNKTNKNDQKKFVNILSNSFCLIHPTTMDTMGAVIIEAGYYGCPSIAPSSFGIPELIQNNTTGIVLDLPFNSQHIKKGMLQLIENKDNYRQMRINVREYCLNNFTYEIIAKKILSAINKK